MCGIVGIVGKTPVNQQIYDALHVLQHRGQDSAGIATCDKDRLILRKNNGLVREVFKTKHMRNLKGSMGIGHVRYPTAGTPSPFEAQPFYVNSPYGLVLAHNGNIINDDKLRNEIFFQDQRHLNTDSDSEVLLNVFAQELTKRDRVGLLPEDVFNAVCNVYERCVGGYSAVAMIVGYGIVAFRDPNGIRPLVLGKRERGYVEYCIASESCALKALGYELVRDVRPGEAIYITENSEFHSYQCYEEPHHTPCLFEYVYMARPDSMLDGVFVHKTRARMGKKLAKKIKREWPEYKENIDVIIPIPSTSRIIALEMAKRLKRPYREGFTKNRYVGRTFIMPGQQMRRKSVRQKLNALDVEFVDKNVLLVDDSIVRGTTSKQIIEMVREAGARSVYFASASPPIRYPNVYGIDMPAKNELIAHGKSEEKVGEEIGADRMFYQDLDDLISCVKKGNIDLEDFDASVFTGKYITGIPEGYLEKLAIKRSDKAKQEFIEDYENEE